MFLGVAAAASLVLLSSNGNAVPIAPDSKLSVTGFNNLDFANQTITFTGANPFNVLGESGSFLNLGTGGTIALDRQGTPINWNNLTSGSNLSCGGGCIYVGSNNGFTVTFNLLTESVIQSGTFLDIMGTGLITLTGFDPTPGVFQLSSQGGTGVSLSFSTTTSVPVPAPVVGAGLPGLLAACLALLALGRRRRAVG